MWYNQLKAMCQRKEEPKMKKRIIAAVLMAVLACIMLVGCDSGDFAPEISEDAYKAQCRQVTYSDLMRDPTGNAGTYIKGEYTVVKLTEGYEYKSGRYGDYIFASDGDGHIFAFFDRRQKDGGIVPGDKVTVYGRFFLVSAVEGSGDRQKHPIAYAGYIDIGKAA